MKFNLHFLLFISCFTVFAQKQTQVESQPEQTTKVKLITTHGDIVLKLYNETPLHRDNFIKIVKDGVLDSLLFHRVIENFMIQSGDTGSKHSKPGDTLGSGDLAYSIPSEITSQYFHKKGVLAAARGDTPERESSSTQFYIVQGKVLNDSLLGVAEIRINGWLAEYYIKHDANYKAKLDSLNVAIKTEDWNTYSRISTKFSELAKTYTGFETYKIPKSHREVYKTIGGTPHLDQNYTVFGEVISGLEVVDSIAAEKTNDLDRPLNDVRILSARVFEEN
jgi:cyclophilin family peptidyl-prolyl cis-trans isomerase